MRTELKLPFLKWPSVSTGTAEEAPPAEETDAQPVKRAAEEEEVGCREARLHPFNHILDFVSYLD